MLEGFGTQFGLQRKRDLGERLPGRLAHSEPVAIGDEVAQRPPHRRVGQCSSLRDSVDGAQRHAKVSQLPVSAQDDQRLELQTDSPVVPLEFLGPSDRLLPGWTLELAN